MNFQEMWTMIDHGFGTPYELQVDTTLARFRAVLNHFEAGRANVIRMYVPGSVGYGHQSSTVSILRQLAAATDSPAQGFGFAGRIDVYYVPDAEVPGDTPTLNKLRALMPELNNGNECVIGGAAVELIAFPPADPRPTQRVEFGFTGGTDRPRVNGVVDPDAPLPNLAVRLNTRWFLVLQPYRWPESEEVQAQPGDQLPGGERVKLTDQASLGGARFQERAYFIPRPTEPDWTSPRYAGSGPAQIVRYLTGCLPQAQPAIDLAPTYGIRSRQMQLDAPATERMFQLIAAALASQRTADGNAVDPTARAIVVLSCDNFGEQQIDDDVLAQTVNERENLRELFDGADCRAEQRADRLIQQYDPTDPKGVRTGINRASFQAAQSTVRGADARKGWLLWLEAGDHVQLLWDPSSVIAVQTKIQEWATAAPGRVLFVQLGRIDPPLFVWCMARANWPTLFEGQNTANTALNLGNQYFHIATRYFKGVHYPTDIVGYYSTTPQSLLPRTFYTNAVPKQIQNAANQINKDLNGWVVDAYPPDVAGGLIREYRNETPQAEPLHTYYRIVRNFYSIPANDKLRLGTSFLQYLMDGEQTTETAAPAAGAPSALDLAYERLELNLSEADKTLHIAPGAFDTGGIHLFYIELLGPAGLVLTDAVLTPFEDKGQLTRVLATGRTDLFGMSLAAAVTFTAPDGVVVAEGRYSTTERWTVAEIPWIAFEVPFVEFFTADQAAPPSGAVGGTLPGLGAQLAFRLPTAEGKWLLSGTFADPPSIRTMYALAGGVDLVRALPEPFATLAGFGVQGVEIAYNRTARRVEYAGFRMGTDAEVALLGTLSLQQIIAQVTVLNPADTGARDVDWSVQGTFTLGDSADPGVVQLSAAGSGTALQGALVSGTLRIGDIVALFAPGVDLGIPDDWAVTEFQAEFAPLTGDYSVSCELGLGWPVRVAGTDVFTIESLVFAAAGSSASSSASLIGYVMVDPDGAAVSLALYGLSQDDGWTFRVVQAPATEFDLGVLANQFLPESWQIPQDDDYSVADLTLTVAYTAGSWSFSGRTADYWIIPFIGGTELKIRAELALGYTAAAQGEAAGYSARLSADLAWHGIELTAYADYQPDRLEWGVGWGGLKGRVVRAGEDGPYVTTLKFSDTTTIGSMIETMVSWATGSRFALEAPWSILNGIPVGGLALEYVFDPDDQSQNSVSFTIDVGPIDLGFARIDSVAVIYNDKAAHKVAVTLRGSFPWNARDGAAGDAGALGPWDASAPGAAPAPPGTGNEYLDLRLLALGQHVTVDDLGAAQTVQAAIKIMSEQLPDTDPGTVPAVTFRADSNWIIGADLGVLRFEDADGAAGYLLTVQTVFNDPSLYALRLALAGPAAKVFSGLDFQIMYRQVSETVGVYQAELALPAAMRRLDLGAYTLTLPSVAAAVYTNGDFQVDIGFPWNGDFSRSFTVEGVIVPGIPVTGSAGLYFGKLSSATSDRVPQALNGTFSPVLVFGFGLTLGFGKSVQYGPLKAGFSVTAGGIVEGVLAAFNPYLPAAAADPEQVQDGYYFWLRGAVAISGRLYGSVDFSVVKANVDVSFAISLQLTYESYVSMSITVIVSVDVSASISIDLGLFSIKLSFSFSMRLHETFTLDNAGTPPWITAAGPAAPHALSGPADRRLLHRRAMGDGEAAAEVRWDRLERSTAGVEILNAYLAPGLTVAHDEHDTTGSAAAQTACYVMLPLIETVPADDGSLEQVLARTAAAKADTSFELLAKMMLRWAISAVQDGQVTPEDLDKRVVTEAELARLRDTVLVSREGNQIPIGPGDVDAFMRRQFRLDVRKPSGSASSSCTSFPMPPGVRVSSKGFNSAQYPAFDYTFADYNTLDDEGVQCLREYFDQLAVQVSGTAAPPAEPRTTGSLSVAQWVQSDYYLLLARQMAQAALDSLRDFKYEITAASTPRKVVEDVNETGRLSGDDRYTVAALFAANAGRALTAGVVLTVAAGVELHPGDSLGSVADRLGSGTTATALAMADAGDAGLLRTGAVIRYRDRPHTVENGETLRNVAAGFDARFADFLSGAEGLFEDTELLNYIVTVPAPLITCRARADSSFATLAAGPAYASGVNPGMTAAQLAERNAARPVLRPGERIFYKALSPFVVQPDDCLADVALAFGISLDTLFGKTDVLTRERLLADNAVLVLPPFGLKVNAGETLASIAERTGTTVEALATWPANGGVAGLFTAGAADTAASWIDVPHLAQYQVGAILAEIQRTLGIQQLSRMAGRYSLHGARLPTNRITPKAKGIWVAGEAGGYRLPAMAGLFALTGQQIAVPDVTTTPGQSWAVVVEPPADSWVAFPAGPLAYNVGPTGPDALDAQRVHAARKAAEYPFAVPLDSLGVGTMTSLVAGPATARALASYPLTDATPWQPPEPVELPYHLAAADADRVQDLRIRALPQALAALPDSRTPGKTAPRFAVRLAAYDESTGVTTTTNVASHGWATVVSFTVRRVPQVAGSPATAQTYEILGAGGADVVLLERIVEQVGARDTAVDRLLVAYAADTTAPGGTPALQSDRQATLTFGIAQVNLSTQTRPPAPGLSAEAAPAGGALMLNKPTAFVRLLWEASITRGGGFFLYYHDGANGRGLPDRLFNDRGEAPVSLIVLYAPGQGTETDRLYDYMNAVVTGTSLDLAQAVVVAEAAPLEPKADSGLGRPLAEIAELTYSDVGDLAIANQTLTLASGATLAVVGGVCQAPPEGIDTAVLASAYHTNPGDLAAANPQWGGALPTRLPGLTALFLPPLALPGSELHSRTLREASDYFGASLTALGHDNAATGGLFAAQQAIVITGGPVARTATVPPGAAAIGASRAKPPAVPLDPRTDPDYGSKLLANTFSLLGYRLAGNVFYEASDYALPAGPAPGSAAGQAAPAPNNDKVRLAADSQIWDYRQVVPAARYAVDAAAPAPALPDPAGSPYRGVGFLLQVEYGWLDYYGNTLVTTLDQKKQGMTGIWNEPPQAVGYTDALLGLGSWPSVAAAWRIAGASGAALLELSLGFDPSPYQGLYRAEADSATRLTALFTDPLDPASAQDPTGYRVAAETGSGEQVPVVAAALADGEDRRRVVLTLGSALAADHVYVLTVTGLLGTAAAGATPPAYSGSASFPTAGSDAAHTSSVIERANRDLGVYTSLYYQLTDPAGVRATVTTTLAAGAFAVAGASWQGLLDWLFTAADCVYAFLAERAAGGGPAAAPPPHTLSFPLAEAALTGTQICRLGTVFTLERVRDAVLGDLSTTPGIRTVSTQIAAATHAEHGQDSLGLTQFARTFEAALSVPQSHRYKVATGVDRAAASPARDGGALWAVRIGSAPGAAISYTVAKPGAPELFAPRPASNTLISRQAVPIYDYSPVSGIAAAPTRKFDFADVDLDVWLRQLLAGVDGTLTPSFVAALQIVTAKVSGALDYLGRILRAKETLADWISALMVPLYRGQSPDAAAVREEFRQQLLDRLVNAYSVRAGIQFRAEVHADVSDPLATEPPRLFGGVLDRAAKGEARSEVTLSSPKLPLQDAPHAALPILLGAPEALSRDGAVVGAVDLALSWEPSSIEHQIGKPAGIDGYLASSWLSFVLPDEPTALLAADLGAFPVPLVLRSFPAGPAMTGQTGTPAQTGTAARTGTTAHSATADLAALTKWDYSFTWSLPFHYEQDRVRGRVEFNLSANPQADPLVDLFPQLAQFITVYPQVQPDMDLYLAAVDATTTSADSLKKADIAARSFVDLLERITLPPADPESALVFRPAPPRLVGAAALTYEFEISEGSVEMADPSTPTGVVRALLVTLRGTLPPGVESATVLVDPGRYVAVPQPVPAADPQLFAFCYVLRGTADSYLTEADAQKIPERTMVLPGLDVFQRQDAWAGAQVTRNADLVPDHPTADAFVYTTPEARFAGPMLPTLDAAVPIDLGALGEATGPRTLDGQFETLFAHLFADLPDDSGPLTIQAEIGYGYRLAPDHDPILLPIFFQAPRPVQVAAGADPGAGETLTEMITAWSEALRAWFAAAPPSGAEGTLHLDLAILSNLTADPMPLFRLRNAFLRLTDVDPPLPTLAQSAQVPGSVG